MVPGEDSNLHVVRHTDLNRARLPIPPPGQPGSEGGVIRLKSDDVNAEIQQWSTMQKAFSRRRPVLGCSRADRAVSYPLSSETHLTMPT